MTEWWSKVRSSALANVSQLASGKAWDLNILPTALDFHTVTCHIAQVKSSIRAWHSSYDPSCLLIF